MSHTLIPARAPVTELAPPAAPAAASLEPTPPPVASHRCANCGSDGCGAFCPRCGQETHDLHRSLAGILGELLDAFAGWDGKIPATLWLMLRRPGALTTEFFAGHRARYLRPLRLYLSMSVVFFLSLQLLPAPATGRNAGASATGRDVVQIDFADSQSLTRLDSTASPERRARSDSAFDAFLERNIHRKGGGAGNWLARHVAGGIRRLRDLPNAERSRVIGEALLSKAPNMVFLLLPVFALLTRMLYRRRSVFYAEHFVFALHSHAFAYLALTATHLATAALRGTAFGSPIKLVLLLWMPVYLFIAMRRVFGGSRPRTFVKFVALSATYGTILSVATVVTALIAIVEMA